MLELCYPRPDFRIRSVQGKRQIFDSWRKSWVALTEEEWVRQNFAAYLIKELNYPTAYISVEKELMLFERIKRFDLLIFDRSHQPWMIVECKAPNVILDSTVLEQAMRYHISIPVPYICITNGPQTMVWKKNGTVLEEQANLPAFP